MNPKVIDKIDNYLRRRSHINYFAIKLISYNNNYIYIRYDYVDKIKAYKVVWFDLKYIDVKHLDLYINSQLVTSYLANKMVEFLYKMKRESTNVFNQDILGDRVEMILNLPNEETRVYGFDRFLPGEWKEFIDPLALIFTYLPRSMEMFLNEIFGIFDNAVEYFNSKKPIKFDLNNGDIDSLFKRNIIIKGRRLETCVNYLEIVEGRYIAVVEGDSNVVVVIDNVTDDFYNMWSSLNSDYLNEYIYAVLQNIRDNNYNPFYKVKYRNKKRNLLDRVSRGDYLLAFGVDGDNLLVVSMDGLIVKLPIMENNKVLFDVIEDDDNLSLSKIISKYEKE